MDFKPLITLLAIVNPLAIVPFYIHYTEGFSPEQKRKTISVASFTVFCVIAGSALFGLGMLEFSASHWQAFRSVGARSCC